MITRTIRYQGCSHNQMDSFDAHYNSLSWAMDVTVAQMAEHFSRETINLATEYGRYTLRTIRGVACIIRNYV